MLGYSDFDEPPDAWYQKGRPWAAFLIQPHPLDQLASPRSECLTKPWCPLEAIGPSFVVSAFYRSVSVIGGYEF